MKTITFYSYKGGVGRTLALSNVATRLSELGKKVCVLDFDLEAPGVNFKFKNYKRSKPILNGIVDYIHKFSANEIVPDKIADYAIELIPNNKFSEKIFFIPAGNTDNTEYWKKLSGISWRDLFYTENAHGVEFFLDVKAKIEKEFNPDVLLIDSRTGITDISGITLKVLADEIVVMAANNDENIFGSKMIIKTLLEPSNSLFGSIPKIKFVLTRIPFTGESKDVPREYSLIERRKRELKSLLTNEEDFLFIRSDRRLEEQEQMLIGYEIDDKSESISNDYFKLFEKLTLDILSREDLKVFQNKKNAEKEFNKAKIEMANGKKIEYLNNAIKLNSNEASYYVERGYRLALQKRAQEAFEDNIKAIELDPQNAIPYYNIGIYYLELERYEEAKNFLNKAIDMAPAYVNPYLAKARILIKQNKKEEILMLMDKLLEIQPNNVHALNAKADISRSIGEYENANAYIYKAIEIDSDMSYLFGTLAEIKAAEGKIDEFYFNLTIALNKGIKAENLNAAKEVYEKFRNEERFINLMNRYEIDIEEIFAEEKK